STTVKYDLSKLARATLFYEEPRSVTRPILEVSWHPIGKVPTESSRSPEKGLVFSQLWMTDSCQGHNTYPTSKILCITCVVETKEESKCTFDQNLCLQNGRLQNRIESDRDTKNG
ncbi:hypothetical protein BHE74_00047340, partial [Ensete ventricosum]